MRLIRESRARVLGLGLNPEELVTSCRANMQREPRGEQRPRLETRKAENSRKGIEKELE